MTSVRHTAELSPGLEIEILVSVDPDKCAVIWKPGKPNRPITDCEEFKYGEATARAWSQLANISGKNLMYVGYAGFADGLKAGGAAEVNALGPLVSSANSCVAACFVPQDIAKLG
jgi:hypothetical protein